jgi:prevent-host-death family protein
VLWQLQEAKQKFSQAVPRALEEGPHLVTRHGVRVAGVGSAEESGRLTGTKLDFAAFWFAGRDLSRLDLERVRDLLRETVR